MEQQWISVKDRFPDQNGVEVLVTDGFIMRIAYVFGRKKEWRFFCGNYFRDISEITHWMPLPESPKEA